MSDTTKTEFVERFAAQAREMAKGLWAQALEGGETGRLDEWWVDASGKKLREALGSVMTEMSERTEPSRTCDCGGEFVFRERRQTTAHTIIAGRDAAVELRYFQCVACGKGCFPAAARLHLCPEGFTEPLRELGLEAAVLEPYQGASELLERFTRVGLSPEKLMRLVEAGAACAEAVQGELRETRPLAPKDKRIIVGIDGGFLHVDGVWQEIKLAVFYAESDVIDISTKRRMLIRREVLAVRGSPDDLIARIRTRVGSAALDHEFVVLADGAPWIRRVAAECFPRCTEILDWYHLKEHVHAAARALFAPDDPEQQTFASRLLDALHEGQPLVALDELASLAKRKRNRAHRLALADLSRYLTDNSDRVDYPAFRAAHLPIGSGVVESAVSHVLQQRMKRNGMRWRARGADHLIALRALYRSTSWPAFLAASRKAA